MKVHDPVLKTGGAANTRLGIVTTRSLPFAIINGEDTWIL
jgi:hypothetical protein